MPDLAERRPPEGEAPIAASPAVSNIDSHGAARSSRVIRCVVALMLYQGFTMAMLGTGASWIAHGFGLD